MGWRRVVITMELNVKNSLDGVLWGVSSDTWCWRILVVVFWLYQARYGKGGETTNLSDVRRI